MSSQKQFLICPQTETSQAVLVIFLLRSHWSEEAQLSDEEVSCYSLIKHGSMLPSDIIDPQQLFPGAALEVQPFHTQRVNPRPTDRYNTATVS